MARPATGQVVERPTARGRSFALRFRAYGRREYLTLGTAEDGWSPDRAESELQNVLADVRRGIWRPPAREPIEQRPEPTFHEFSSEWLDQHQAGLRPRTREDYRWALSQHLLPFFAKHRLGQITIEEVDRYRAQQLRTGTLSANTLNKTITRLAQVLEVAVEYGYLTANPARGRRRRAKATAPRRTWLDPEQVKPLLGATVRVWRGGSTTPDVRMRAMFATAICAGLRISELLALRWRDVDLAGGRLTVRESKTDAGQRVVDLWPELADELATFKAQTSHDAPGGYVFATSRGKPDTRSNVAKRLRRAVTRANEQLEADGLGSITAELTPHSLRRTFAALLYERGEDPVYVMDQMGHSDPKLALRIYTKVVSRQRRRGKGERLVGVLGGAEWARMGTSAASDAMFDASPLALENEKTPR
jgi:integrase